MKTEKFNNSYWFYYTDSETKGLHGLYNLYNLDIGYIYQHKRKGFWLWS
jgi:hypothetical protein